MLNPRVTMSDIARRAGVSKNTVSLALRNAPQIPAATRERIQKVAAAMGYHGNPVVSHLMVQLRSMRTPNFKATLALLNAHEDSHAFQKHHTVPNYVAGCERRAHELGYTLDRFWLHDPQLDGIRLNRVFKNRNIRGAVIVGLMHYNRLPERFLSTWQQFPCVVTGVRTHEPVLPFSAVDHHTLVLKAFEQAVRLGYRRPALVIDGSVDELVDGRFSAGFFTAQHQNPKVKRVKPFYLVYEGAAKPKLFFDWYRKERPDLIMTLDYIVVDWLAALGLEAPKDIGLIQLERVERYPHWAGMEQHNDMVGEAAIDMLIGLIHSNFRGIGAIPRSTLVESSWRDGRTVHLTPHFPSPAG